MVVFFFKQKTAYEMRISDWSSDVCSSDLDVSFDVHAGEILVIMGLSGSGKSTLIRCLTRLIKPNAGQVLFDGVDLLQASHRSLTDIRRRKMGMVFQNRSEERRGGKEWVSTCRSRWSPNH